MRTNGEDRVIGETTLEKAVVRTLVREFLDGKAFPVRLKGIPDPVLAHARVGLDRDRADDDGVFHLIAHILDEPRGGEDSGAFEALIGSIPDDGSLPLELGPRTPDQFRLTGWLADTGSEDVALLVRWEGRVNMADYLSFSVVSFFPALRPKAMA
jgi:hypothetical protein